MAPPIIVPGQRLVSDSEPELGLGTLVSADRRSLVVRFDATDEERRYAPGSAPIHRVTFAAGDQIADSSGHALTVDDVEFHDGLAFYLCGETVVPETEISPRISLGGPKARLLSGRCDASRLFELRRDALERLQRIRQSPVRGLVGPRLELLPHQFYIAAEITSRHRPRVLLADQTGLGKTIEACLILHRLLLTGRARRALILVPDPLVHQWLVELSRRFNLRVALFDEARCAAIQESDATANPFESEQIVLAGWSLLAGNEKRTQEAAAAGWDMVVVDEAHHLTWSAGEGGTAYQAVERVGTATAGLVLLTATPTQLGEEGHFARLRLLDPARHSDFETWRKQDETHQQVARLGALLVASEPLSPDSIAGLATTLGRDPVELRRDVAQPRTRARLLAELIDRHGPGRAMFSNTRAVLRDHPARHVVMRPLAAPPHAASLSVDPRVGYLESLLRGASDDKFLVTCRTAASARAIKAELDRRLRADIALFHEDIELLERDRNAAWFVEPEGARMLICSEIGSEGRNFQNARHLVMFDLPIDPDLVEQRIGRVDRIGQRADVVIDVPYVRGTGHEVLARWHHEGVGAFARPVSAGQPILERFGARVQELAEAFDGQATSPERAADLELLIAETASESAALAMRLERGRDRLLEMSSFRPEVAAPLLAEIREGDADDSTDDFFLRLLEHYQVIAEELGPRTYRFDPDGLAAVNFAALTRGDVTFTFDREKALLREDFEFASVDHPLMIDALELFIDSESGNASFAVVEAAGVQRLLLESVFVLEVVAPLSLHADRFLPPTCVRVLVDQTGAECGDTSIGLESVLEGDRRWFLERGTQLQALVNSMLGHAERLAEQQAASTREAAHDNASEALGAEVDRLRTLARTNSAVSDEDVAQVQDELDALGGHLRGARLRLDALRVIWNGPVRDGAPTTAC